MCSFILLNILVQISHCYKGNSIRSLFIPYKLFSLALISLLFSHWNLTFSMKSPLEELSFKIRTQQVGISNRNKNRTITPWEVPGVSRMSPRWSKGRFRNLVYPAISFGRIWSRLFWGTWWILQVTWGHSLLPFWKISCSQTHIAVLKRRESRQYVKLSKEVIPGNLMIYVWDMTICESIKVAQN